MRSFEEAVSIVQLARRNRSNVLSRMIAVRDHYNADVVTPTWDVPGSSAPGRSPNPLLIADAIESNAQQASSIIPSIVTPLEDVGGGKGSARRQREAQERKRKLLEHTWRESAFLESALGRWFRHYFAYGSMAFLVRPYLNRDKVRVKVVNPLQCYSDHVDPEDYDPPSYLGVIHPKPTSWLKAKFFHELGSDFFSGTRPDELWDILEWVDADQTMVGLLGSRSRQYVQPNGATDFAFTVGGPMKMLRRWENRLGFTPAYVSDRVTLDRVESSVMKLTGLANEIGRMRTLEKIAAERGVFPDIVAFGDSSSTPELVNGQWSDGREGVLNIVSGAKGFQVIRMDPSVVSRQVTDLMEGAFMQSAGLDPMSIGQSRGSSLRTGRALNTMADFSMNPRLQEAHRQMARFLTLANSAVVASYRAYFGPKKITFFSGRPTDPVIEEVVPKRDCITDFNTVVYPIPGSSVTSVQVAIGNALQTGQISRETARQLNPLIDDAGDEGKRRVSEELEKVLLSGFAAFAQTAQDGATLVDLAGAVERYADTGDLATAIRYMDDEARKRQANAAPSPEDQVGGIEPQNPGAKPLVPTANTIEKPEQGNRLRQVLASLNANVARPNRIP